MSCLEAQSIRAFGEARHFQTTNWTAVCEAGNDQCRTSNEALEKLCAAYWTPLYQYIRRMGYGEADAEDLTQEFFARFLQKNYVSAARRDRGRFRSFLLTCVQHFLVEKWRGAHRVKRGGREKFIAWEEAHSFEAQLGHPTAAEAYDQRWALALFGNALARLQNEFDANHKRAQYEELKQFLSSEGNEQAYLGSARKLGISSGAVRVMVHRLRGRYRELVREEIAKTVSKPAEVGAELSYLISLVMHSPETVA
jgi:DNA-directed RNA polymerase specialized sigma24 family protein